jgi:transposase
VRVAGRTCWNWVFQNSEVVVHVIRSSRSAGVVREVLDGHRPALWVSDLYSAQLGHAEDWQICLAHQLRGCTYAIEAVSCSNRHHALISTGEVTRLPS